MTNQIEYNNEYTADIYNLGILKEYHKQGIGTKLIEFVEQYCIDNNYIYKN